MECSYVHSVLIDTLICLLIQSLQKPCRQLNIHSTHEKTKAGFAKVMVGGLQVTYFTPERLCQGDKLTAHFIFQFMHLM